MLYFGPHTARPFLLPQEMKGLGWVFRWQ